MTTLFNKLVTLITNSVTGLDNTNLTLYNFGTWFNARQEVATCLNVACLIITVSMIACITRIAYGIYENHKKLHSAKEIEL